MKTPISRLWRTWMVLALLCSILLFAGACKEEGKIDLKLTSGGGQDLGKVETLLFHFNGSGLLETPKPFEVPIDDGAAKIPSLSIDENAKDPYFDAQVFGLDSAGKVAAYGALRLPLVSKSFEYTLFMSATEQFARLTKLDSPSDDNLMPQSIVGHRVVPLQDGRILVTGGVTQFTENKGLLGVPDYRKMVRNLLIYDPTTGIFDTGPQLGNSRAFHTATLLPDGRVLLAGGLTYISRDQKWELEAVRTFEIFDPKDGSLVLGSGPMLVPRAFHTASLLKDGSVILVGGLSKPIAELAGGLKCCHQVTKVESYRAATREGGQLVGDIDTAQGRFLHQAVAVSEDKVLVVGGLKIDGNGDRVVQTVSLMLTRGSDARWSWRALTAAKSKPRYDHTLVAATIGDNTWAIAVGGRDGNNAAVAEIEIYREDGVMYPGGKLKEPRYGHAGIFMNNQKMLVVGGNNALHKPATGAEVYEVSEVGDSLKVSIQNVTPTLIAAQGRYKPAVAVSLFDARVFVIGGATLQSEGTGPVGHTFRGINTTELYTPVLPVPTAQ